MFSGVLASVPIQVDRDPQIKFPGQQGGKECKQHLTDDQPIENQ